MTELATHACRGKCSWEPSTDHRDGLAVFRCAGCLCEWVRTELWTPVQADGTVPDAVASERAKG